MPTFDASIIVTCFDEEPRWIRAAVNSSLGQRGCRVEVIVVNDGSTSAEVLEELDNLPPEVEVIHRRNGGPAAARNTGMSEARGRYLLALDADDTVDPDAVHRMISVLEARPDAAVARIRMIRVDEKGREHAERPEQLIELTLRELVIANGIPGPSLFRAYDWRRRNGYDESLGKVGFEDYEWWVRLLSDGAVAVPVPDAVVRCRERANSRMNGLRRDSQAALARTRIAMIRNSPQIAEDALLSLWFVIERQQEMLTREGPTQRRRVNPR